MRLFLRPVLAAAVALTAAAPAFADPPRHARGNDRAYERDYRDVRDDRRDYRDDRREYRDDRRNYRSGYQEGRRDARHWRKGDRFDRHNTRYVVVNDYHRYNAPPPRRGQYYAQTETGELLLIAAATGLVLWALND